MIYVSEVNCGTREWSILSSYVPCSSTHNPSLWPFEIEEQESRGCFFIAGSLMLFFLTPLGGDNSPPLLFISHLLIGSRAESVVTGPLGAI